MNNGLLLWVDDEVELLKAHIIFLEKKGYQVVTVSNGADAIEQCRQQTFDLILLDEMMPGLSGLETLQQIKDIQPSTPVVMCTKSEEEDIMNQAIGSKIADYLIKPVNPNQILLSLKKNIHQKEIVSEVTQSSYQQEYQQLAMQIMDSRSWKDWMEIYRRLVKWELELSSTNSPMTEMLQMQKEDANQGFAKYVAKNYLDWMQQLASLEQNNQRPCMSPDVFKTKIFPLLNQGEKVFLIVIDNFRYDQWKVLAHDIADLFDIEEDMYMSILPTATQYARNAIFSGLMPNKIAEMFPDLWVDEEEEEGKNLNEGPLIQTQFDRYRRHNTFSYHKLNDRDREYYLKMLIHLIGDMHCPMHAGHLSDKGGNYFDVYWFKQPTNLHSVWDTKIIESARKWSYSEWRDNLNILDKKQIDSVTAGSLYDWFIHTTVLARNLYSEIRPKANLSYDYVAQHVPMLEEQLTNAGYRLAKVLNEIFK